jgi:hypothetical protein
MDRTTEAMKQFGGTVGDSSLGLSLSLTSSIDTRKTSIFRPVHNPLSYQVLHKCFLYDI